MTKNISYGLEKIHVAFKGQAQTEKIEVTGAPSTDGEITIEVTAGTLLGADSPHSVVIPLASETHTTANKVASAIVNVLNNDDVISEVFRAKHEAGVIYLMAKIAQENDSTLSVSFTDTGTTGATLGSSEEVVAGTTGYGPVKSVPGGVEISLNPAGDTTEHYHDNTKAVSIESNDGYEGNLELSKFPDEILAEMQGHTIDSNGGILETANDKPKEFALMYETDGTEEKIRSVFYRVKAERAAINASTNNPTANISTENPNITVMPELISGEERVRYSRKESQTGFDTFFDSVPFPTV